MGCLLANTESRAETEAQTKGQRGRGRDVLVVRGRGLFRLQRVLCSNPNEILNLL